MSTLLIDGQPSWVVCIFVVAKKGQKSDGLYFLKFGEKIVNVALARTYASTYGR